MTGDPGSTARLRRAVVFAFWVVALITFTAVTVLYHVTGHALVSAAIPTGVASVTGALYLINDRKGNPR